MYVSVYDVYIHASAGPVVLLGCSWTGLYVWKLFIVILLFQLGFFLVGGTDDCHFFLARYIYGL